MTQKKIPIAFILILITFLCCVNSRYAGRYATDKDKKIVWNNCFQCHAPSVILAGMPLDEMYNEFGDIKLKQFLLDEFNSKSNCIVSEHCTIRMSRKEVNAVMVYLKEIQ
jgi:hypothetical protein